MKKRRNSPLGSKLCGQDGSRSVSAAEVDPRVLLSTGAAPEYPLKIRHLIMSQQGQNLLEFLNEDHKRRQFCDVMVSVGGNLYSAHKVVLAHGSSYFHAELSKNPTTAHVTLDHVEASVFQHLLELLYTSQCFIMEKDLPALIRAARFLDMMDVLKLLPGDSDPVEGIREEGGVRGREAEKTSCESAAGDADVHSPDSLCSTGSGQVNSSGSPQSQSAEGHAHVYQETPAEAEKTTAATRRSTRRRTLASYQRNNTACVTERPCEEQTEARRPTGIARPAQEPGEDEGGANDEEACVADRPEGQPGSGVIEADHQTLPDGETGATVTGSSTPSPVYPEGLAPVIIHASNKKTLKCPKCDKTFDRAGGAVPGVGNLFRFCCSLKKKVLLKITTHCTTLQGSTRATPGCTRERSRSSATSVFSATPPSPT